MRKNQLSFSALWVPIFVTLLVIIPQSSHAAAVGIAIDKNHVSTKTREVDLEIYPTDTTYQMRIANNIDFKGAYWESIKTDKKWTLDFGAGTQTVYIQFRTRAKKESSVMFDTIRLDVPANMAVDFIMNKGERATNSRYVDLELQYSEGVESVALSNDAIFSGARFIPIQKNLKWIISPLSGEKFVYLRFRDANGATRTVSRSVMYTEPPYHLAEESLIKGDGDTVYYLGYDGQLHPYLHSVVYHSYNPNFNGVKHVSDQKLREYFIGEPVCMKPGTWLVKFQSLPRVYAVEPGCRLKPIRSEVEAFIYYGDRWAGRILEIAPAFEGFYTIEERTIYDREDDRDQDGVNKDTEESYGTSDQNGDSDNDRLSDFEEINYWYTDPTKKDTDGDGIYDGDEILLKRAPYGAGTISALPEGTYIPPQGSAVLDWWSKKQIYYQYHDGWTYYLSQSTADEAFVSNGLQRNFLLVPPFPLSLNIRDGWHIYSDSLQIRAPQATRYNTVTPL
ncbi:MAG: hypothetical protein COU33_00470 [Candidatus Magasanikbacteria bacterium CG10_big_fil_rev_8_21_14_0_10_43_6]|uniref:Uncharacterized protein n=1 Tax=Candidatus Magasanikbacteria bacterium CG10_big_fil_rev_8_21_14_0_10_43_6 TaxID=1974650 RepID=A0A2M6W2B7_9BACT|nr:MAG: hypothetical protein COU33_00470 [Candidatus Magasanikbacteria bacterium CG10_big_fil_rev_8_21_14_0_10_43_6]